MSQALVKIYIHIFYKNDILNKIVEIFLISKPIKTAHCCFGKSPYDLKILLGAHNMDDKNITRTGFYLGLENPMVEKKANLWLIPLFHARRPKVCIQGYSTLKKRLVAKFFGFEASFNR